MKTRYAAFVLLIILALASFSIAQEDTEADQPEIEEVDTRGIHEPGTGLADSELKEEGQGTAQGQQLQDGEALQNQGEVQAVNAVMAQNQIMNKEQLKEAIQAKQQQMNQELESLSDKEANVYKNQNQVRLAVHSMLAMENLMGGIGKNVSEIAKQFNNSVQATIQAEEKIQKKSAFARMLTGGDKQAAEEIEAQVVQNQDRIQQLTQYMQQCTECDGEVKAMLQEQIQNMEQEQTRLQALAAAEKKSKGLLGWMFK